MKIDQDGFEKKLKIAYSVLYYLNQEEVSLPERLWILSQIKMNSFYTVIENLSEEGKNEFLSATMKATKAIALQEIETLQEIIDNKFSKKDKMKT